MHFQNTLEQRAPQLAIPHGNNIGRSALGPWQSVSADTIGLVGAPVAGGLAPWQIKRVAEHIESNLCEKLHLDDLAILVKLSTSYFSAAFRRNFGISPHLYIIGRRVELAKQLMAEEGMQLCEIALECGFADQAHLSRLFRRVTNMAPTAYRQRLKRQGINLIAA